jgi:hypothetical protein
MTGFRDILSREKVAVAATAAKLMEMVGRSFTKSE